MSWNPADLKHTVPDDVMYKGAASKDRDCIHRTYNMQTLDSQCKDEAFDVLSNRHVDMLPLLQHMAV